MVFQRAEDLVWLEDKPFGIKPLPQIVLPAKAGPRGVCQKTLDSRFRGNDGPKEARGPFLFLLITLSKITQHTEQVTWPTYPTPALRQRN
jgi:hypothetical protein